VGVAAKAVQHQHLRQPPLWCGAPSKQLAPGRSLQLGAESGANDFVQLAFLDEVQRGT